jgi:hypothetical protein
MIMTEQTDVGKGRQQERCAPRRYWFKAPSQKGWGKVLPPGPLSLALSLIEQARDDGLVRVSNAELAEEFGVSEGTIDRWLGVLRTTKVPGCDHNFLQSQGQNASRRLYPIDEWGNPRAPAPHTRAREAPAPRRRGSGAASPTIKSPRASFSCTERDNENEAKKAANDNDQAGLQDRTATPQESRTMHAAVDAAVDADCPACTPTVPAAAFTSAPEVVKAATAARAGIGKPLTAGQLEFLATLTPAQSSAYCRLMPHMRRALLDPHEGSYNREQGEKDRSLQLRLPPPAAPPAPPPRSTAELIEQLPNSDGTWCKLCAEALCRDFEDQPFFTGFDMVCCAVWRGTLEARHVLGAYRRAMRQGVPRVRKRGAMFWRVLCDRAKITPEQLPDLAAGRAR